MTLFKTVAVDGRSNRDNIVMDKGSGDRGNGDEDNLEVVPVFFIVHNFSLSSIGIYVFVFYLFKNKTISPNY